MNEDVRLIEDAFQCGFRYTDPPVGVFSWTGHKSLCSHPKNKKNSCESEKDFGWWTKKRNHFPDSCPLQKIIER